jgi:hypothetical protein
MRMRMKMKMMKILKTYLHMKSVLMKAPRTKNQCSRLMTQATSLILQSQSICLMLGGNGQNGTRHRILHS